VRLKRGLNIVWAPPEEATQPAQMYEDGIAGHASGKTTFCRVLRFVLGEGNFGPDALREAVRETFRKHGRWPRFSSGRIAGWWAAHSCRRCTTSR